MLKSGDRVRIYYARTNRLPDLKWRERCGVVLVVGYGRGPRNVLVLTDAEVVVVPWGTRCES
ncbi:hypothetical protein EDD75_0421 [Thermodesulfitimonas autotrophica]|uniref:Uncharacterized protein n=1 Tax=Thermodesulfitimonas autotrophica TaxID=1894989 RepID=A0A3N5BPR0_9THEO|nr:hypothetical protein [Thermodesulfitimonas autotrophica]RPF49602.1 hypothetical protein EDD75_0421 [Thermodesulfitimonas autotrophica]